MTEKLADLAMRETFFDDRVVLTTRERDALVEIARAAQAVVDSPWNHIPKARIEALAAAVARLKENE